MNKNKANLLIVFIAVIFGGFFVVQKVALDMGYSPGLILLGRGLVFLIASAAFLGRGICKFTKRSLLLCSVAGFLYALAVILQTIGSKYTTPSNNAFLTCLNTMFVPLFSLLLCKKKPSKRCFIASPDRKSVV